MTKQKQNDKIELKEHIIMSISDALIWLDLSEPADILIEGDTCSILFSDRISLSNLNEMVNILNVDKDKVFIECVDESLVIDIFF